MVGVGGVSLVKREVSSVPVETKRVLHKGFSCTLVLRMSHARISLRGRAGGGAAERGVVRKYSPVKFATTRVGSLLVTPLKTLETN